VIREHGLPRNMLNDRAIAEFRAVESTDESRRALLARLAADDGAVSLATFAELIATDPPRRVEDALVAFAPLLRPRRELAAEALFPRLLDGLAHLSVAAIVLDVTNHFARTGVLRPHPAGSRAAQLTELFGRVTIGLEKLGVSAPAQDAASWHEQRQSAEEASALLISLCDALALVGDRSVCDKLRAALDLPHRRLRTEAAAALARLGQPDGIAALADLTAEPVVRTRAIAYLEELGLADEVPLAFRSPLAKAEGTLAQWLAAPMQFGVPPARIELTDHRRQYWPGFSEQIDCFLFRYAYAASLGTLRGVAIVGPLIHTTACDLDGLPPEYVYALFAGFQAEHDQIAEQPLSELSGSERDMVGEVCGRFGPEFSHVSPIKLGHFFGERHVVASAQRAGESGTLVIDAEMPHWYRAGDPHRPLGDTEAYQIHKGRKLLSTFNSHSGESERG
jgi:hypothetical protein